MDESSRLSRLALAGLILGSLAVVMSGVLALLARQPPAGGPGGIFALGAIRAMLGVAIIAVAAAAMLFAGLSLWRYRSGPYTRSSQPVALLALFAGAAVLIAMML